MEDLWVSLLLGWRNVFLIIVVMVEEKGEGEMKVLCFVCYDFEERLLGLGVSCLFGGNIGGICWFFIGEVGCELLLGEVVFESSMIELVESVLSFFGGMVGF